MLPSLQPMEIQLWPAERLIFYARNPRKNDAAVDRMCGSIREFGFIIPVLARSDGEVVDGHLRLKASGGKPGGRPGRGGAPHPGEKRIGYEGKISGLRSRGAYLNESRRPGGDSQSPACRATGRTTLMNRRARRSQV